MPTYRVTALGCKVSRADAAAIEWELRGAGFEKAPGGAPATLCVVCGCAVTAVAEGKSRRAIRRLARENPGATVVAAGCIASREAASRGAGAELLLPPGRTDGILEALRRTGRWRDLHAPSFAEAAKGGAGGGTRMRFPGRTRAFLKVQDGCDGACAYCIVPRLRGRSTSRPAREILEEARRLARAGHAEIVLVGIRLGSYADGDSGAGLARLVESLLGIRSEGLARLRLSSIEPMDFDMRLAEIAASGSGLCPHFHLPLQSADDETLLRMNRPYGVADYRALLERIRALVHDAAVTTDVIAGFPGETPEAHARTMEFVSEARFARVHAFPFSPRPGTAAWDMPHEPGFETARARTAELIDAGRAAAREYRERFIGREVEVIAEPGSESQLSGYTDRYVRITFAGPAGLVGSLVRVRAVGQSEGGLAGEIAR